MTTDRLLARLTAHVVDVCGCNLIPVRIEVTDVLVYAHFHAWDQRTHKSGEIEESGYNIEAALRKAVAAFDGWLADVRGDQHG